MYYLEYFYTSCRESMVLQKDALNHALIRTIFFLMTAVGLGLPAVLWALRVQHRHRKSGGRTSVISIFLLLSDLLELISKLVLVAFSLRSHSIPCGISFALLFGIRTCGHHLHQLVALESVLFLRYPSVASIFSPLCSTVLCSVVVVLVTVLMCLNIFGLFIILFLSFLPVAVVAVTCLLTCESSSEHVLPMNRKLSVLVQSVSMVTLVFLYVPYFLEVVVDLPFKLHHLVSLRVISEPLLSVLVCKESHWAQKEPASSEQSSAP